VRVCVTGLSRWSTREHEACGWREGAGRERRCLLRRLSMHPCGCTACNFHERRYPGTCGSWCACALIRLGIICGGAWCCRNRKLGLRVRLQTRGSTLSGTLIMRFNELTLAHFRPSVNGRSVGSVWNSVISMRSDDGMRRRRSQPHTHPAVDTHIYPNAKPVPGGKRQERFRAGDVE
jgi:hypothetical protein